MIAGVAAGIAAYLNIDPTIVRVLWVVAALASGGLFVIVYIAMVFVVPEEPGTIEYGSTTPAPEARSVRGPDGAVVLGAALVVLGGLFLLRELIPALDFDILWPVGLVIIGVLLVVGAARGPRSS
jgi:phage shock protein PspC (stress-responsive transcriptional regulator)